MYNLRGSGSFTTKNIVKISILSLIGFILTMINFNVPIFPPFLLLDIGDVPTVIGTIAMGPWAGIAIQLVKNLIKVVIAPSVAGVGELANFVIGVSYVVPFAFVYFHGKIKSKNFLLGAIAGTLGMMIVGAISNWLIFLPIYAMLLGGMDTIIEMASTVNENITNAFTLVIVAITPFNLLKGSLTSIVAYVVYKSIKPILQK